MTDKARRIGKFFVPVTGDLDDRLHRLRIAQEGCAVLRCECLDYARMYEVIAEHPSFQEVPAHLTLPEYDCEFTKGIGGVVTRTFKPRGA